MNKTAIKNFAVWARNKLIADITYKAGLIGVTEKGILSPLPQSTRDLQFFDIGTKEYAQIEGTEIKQRNALVEAIHAKEADSDYETAFKSVIEEVAYTWFNRLIAIRFMEVNDYLPSRVRVLSSENPAKNEPDFVTTPFDTDLEFTGAETEEILQMKEQNQLDELFRMLFIKQCNQLHEILPKLFEETSDYTELLLTISFTDTEGIVYHLTHDIEEKDFDIEQEGQVEIIGWLYQYYNTELNEQVYDGNMSKSRISKELLPAATTIYTPDWAIQYMVQNSLGRLWIEGHPNDSLKVEWKYYLEEAEQKPEVREQLAQIRSEYKIMNPEDIKVIDPCMGSGHILVYCFDVLMQIYESQGYSERDAAQSILEHNLYGLDIDDRAAQLAYFAVMMKARQYDRRIFTREITPHIHAIQESNNVNRNQFRYFGVGMNAFEKNTAINEIEGLLDTLIDAKEYGSILNVDEYNWELLRQFVENVDTEGQLSFDSIGLDDTKDLLLQLIEIGQIMGQKYDVVVTNPPYLGSSRFSVKLDKYVKDNYPDEKSDLSMVMYKRALTGFSHKNAYVSFITTSSWMFLSSFEKMRKFVQNTAAISTLVDFGTELFDGKVGHNPIVAWVTYNLKLDYKMMAIRLVDYCYSRRDEKEHEFFEERNCYTAQQDDFSKIPGQRIAYWISKKLLLQFQQKPLSEYADTRRGLQTGNSERFIRKWFEVAKKKTALKPSEETKTSGVKWFLFNSGGAFRRWYGNIVDVVNWEKNGADIKSTGKAIIPSEERYFDELVSWNKISSGKMSVRYQPYGVIPGDASPFLHSISHDTHMILYAMAIMNSKVSAEIVKILSPTLNFEVGNIAQIPIALDEAIQNKTVKKVHECIELSKTDWDSFETSWNFQKHPIVEYRHSVSKAEIDPNWSNMSYYVQNAYEAWEYQCQLRFNTLKANEEELNRIFINIYGLQDELTPEVEDKDITVRKADLQRDIKSLISYAVGCMFGRYSLDETGLILAGQPFSDKFAYASVLETGTGVCGAPLSAHYVSGDCYLRKEDGTVSQCTFEPDRDNVIPITDEEYFPDDIVGLFCSWLKKVYGADTLEENLDFIAKALGNKGNTSREVIRNYFLTDFIKDHNKIYQKRPIYWLFDSGKQNGFKALVYMHRWNADTVGNLRVEYLHKTQHIYEREIQRMQEIIDGNDAREKSKAVKRQAKLVKQLQETKDYDAKLAHIALSRIEIDLDDGVKVNYEKVQTGRDGKKMQILAKI